MLRFELVDNLHQRRMLSNFDLDFIRDGRGGLPRTWVHNLSHGDEVSLLDSFDNRFEFRFTVGCTGGVNKGAIDKENFAIGQILNSQINSQGSRISRVQGG